MKYLQSTVRSLLLAPVTAATTARTANLDTSGADYASIVIALGQEANTNSTGTAIQLSESDDTVATNFATFNADYNFTQESTSAIDVTLNVDLKARKRYLRLTLTPDTTTNGAVLSCAVAELDKEIRNSDNDDNGSTVVVG